MSHTGHVCFCGCSVRLGGCFMSYLDVFCFIVVLYLCLFCVSLLSFYASL